VEPLRVAIAGVGYWGINLVRVMAAEPGARVTWLCDSDEKRLLRASAYAPSARASSRLESVLEAPDVDAVVLATPAVTHAELACMALAAGKHVFVEKPVALDVTGAAAVAAAAASSGSTVMVGHLMLYHPAVERIRSLVQGGELGDLYYLYATRVNLGRLRTDENALWSFAPHDLSMIDYLLGALPESVSARGGSYLQPGIEDVVFLSLRFGRQMAHVHLSWLDPHKERRLTVVGSKKMVMFDDVSTDKLRIYDKGYDRPPAFERYGEYLTIRHGDIHIPHLDMTEPLAAECRHFVDCCRRGDTPRSDISSAVRIVRILAAAQESLEHDGRPVTLQKP